jgi:hypothetical protein
VQERELALVRAHEQRLLERETNSLIRELGRGTSASAAIARMSSSLRHALRLAGGEDADAAAVLAKDDGERAWDEEPGDWDEARTAAWALSREAELARLERENEELRRLLAGAQVQPPAGIADPQSSAPAAATPALPA